MSRHAECRREGSLAAPFDTPVTHRKPLPPRRSILVASLAAALLVAAGCANYLDARAEAALREALVRVVGPAEAYDVTVSGASVGGRRLERVGFVGRRIARADAPVLDHLALDLRSVVVDRDEKRLVAVGSARAELQLRGMDLAEFLRRSEWIADPAVTFSSPDRLRITGTPRLAGIVIATGAAAEFEGRLFAAGPQLRLTVDRVRLGPASAPPLLRALIERAVNPLFDLSAYPLPAQIDAVEAGEGGVRIVGSGSRLPASMP